MSVETKKTKASDEFDQFVYLVSHDIRAPIRALQQLPKWVAEDLARAGGTIPESVTENLELMQRRMKRLETLLDDLLAFSRIGRKQDKRQERIGAALQDILSDVAVPERFHLETQLDDSSLFIGVEDIRRLLRALITNAIKHHDRQDGTVRVTAHQDGKAVEISVIDDGPGIAADAIQKIREPMVTLRPRDVVEGSGMGLAIADRIAQHYGGSLEISGQIQSGDRGCRVTVSLPRDGRHPVNASDIG